MPRRLFLSFSAAILAIAGLFAAGPGRQAQVVCCGECKPGDNCLEKCRLIGEVPKDLKLTCCGKCQKGDDCLRTCGSGDSCCSGR